MRTRRRHRGAWLTVIGAVAVIGGLAAAQLTANVQYDDAKQAYEVAADAASDRADALTTEVAELQAVNDSASTIVAGDSGTLLDAATKEALAAAIDSGAAAVSDAESQLEESLPRVGEKPFWFWELFGGAQQLEQNSADAQEHSEDLQELAAAAVAETTAVDEAGVAALSVVGDAAASFAAAHVSARNLDVVALLDAADRVRAATTLDASSASDFTTLEAAAAQVVASEQAELAEKAGPLIGVRLEIEAFARSLAPGVLLDFDWAPLVNGYGAGGTLSGYATWWYDDPGYATLQFSDSVAEQWPGESSRALVAHEVGHAISVKCPDAYDDSTQESIEAWATAWAISMGFTNDANGVSAYGYPPQSYIDAAAGCR